LASESLKFDQLINVIYYQNSHFIHWSVNLFGLCSKP